MSFSNNLRYLRGGKQISAERVAKELRITRSAYSNYEQGIREPDFATLKKIATYFEVSIDYLLDFEDESGKKQNR
ncbi:MAG: helix-turn-helix domain-containing protein [Clostridiales bacterium]|jgi:transcriptional regulator with XRE-family HTH domain|nr:helix-turn-helix domain-containing protein [Clostridiales bacterium]